jgi:hypothetical protein
MTVFWHVAPCSLVEVYRRLPDTRCNIPEDQNIVIFILAAVWTWNLTKCVNVCLLVIRVSFNSWHHFTWNSDTILSAFWRRRTGMRNKKWLCVHKICRPKFKIKFFSILFVMNETLPFESWSITKDVIRLNWLIPWSRVVEKFIVAQEIPRLHNSVRKRPPQGRISSQLISLNVLTSYCFKIDYILILSFCLCLGLPSGLFLSGIPIEILYTFLISPVCCLSGAVLIFPNLIVLMIFGEEYKLWSSSLCSILHYLLTSCLLGPNILLSSLFSYPVCNFVLVHCVYVCVYIA